MKNLLCCLAVILVVLLIIAFIWLPPFGTAPSDTVPTETTGATEGTTLPTQGTTAATQPTVLPGFVWAESDMAAISMPVNTDSITADDGTVLFNHVYQDVALRTTNVEVTHSITLDLLKRIDSGNERIASIVQSARDAYASNAQSFSSYSFRVIYTPQRLDNRVLSFYGTEDSFLGADHPSSTGVAVTYSLETGKALTLGELLSGSDTAATALQNALLAALQEQSEDLNLFADFADTINRRFQATMQEYDSWYLTSEGLCFFFHPYDIAPSATGTIHITLPYSALGNVLKENFFPDILPETGGELIGAWFDNVDTGSFSYFTELIVDSDAEFSAFYVEKPVFNVSIEAGVWNSEQNAFIPSSTIFAAGSVIEKEAIILQAKLSQTTPTLRLSYEADGIRHSYFILRDFRDNSVLLQAAGG